MTTFKRKPLYDLARSFSRQITKNSDDCVQFYYIYILYYYIDSHNVNTVKNKNK